jgi:tetratricopeptide (TPR) repeat protein
LTARIAICGVLLAAAVAPAAAQGPRGLSDRGLDSLRQATRIDSVDAEAYYRYGLGLWEKKKFDAADSAFRRALHFAPWHAAAHLALGALPYGRGDRYMFDLPHRVPADSFRNFVIGTSHQTRDALLSDPLVDLSPLRFLDDEALVSDRGRLACIQQLCFVLAGRSRWFHPMRAGARYLVRGRADSAYQVLAKAMAARDSNETLPDDFIWYFALAADRSGHPELAMDGFRELAQRASRRESQALILGPTGGDRDLFLALYGMAADRVGRPAIARAALREALIVDLSLYQAHSRLADIAEAMGNTEEAIAERRAAIDVAPDVGRLHLDLGVTLLQAGHPAEAKAEFREAQVTLPWDPGVLLFLFQSAITTSDRPTAEQALASLELFAPQRNAEQVADARRRLAELQ